jgi:8-oxo-dGTP pyrophosphatase MutT (NUDIX family)
VTRILEISAGGLVIAGDRIVVLQNASGTWVLPKGKLRSGEDYARAAIREVGEETGVRARVVRKLEITRYSYQSRGHAIEKSVYWFLMEPESGTVVLPTDGFRRVVWLSLDEAVEKLSWEGERGVVAALARPRKGDAR